MAVPVLIHGRPGSGKTTAASYITELAKQKGLTTDRLTDYDILYRKFEQDTFGVFKTVWHEGRKGFDVVNFDSPVLDDALIELNAKALAMMNDPKRKHSIVMLEFARDNYCEAFQKFSPALLAAGYFLFIEADVKVCVERIHRRVRRSDSLDDHYVSEQIVRNYYGQDNIFAGCNPVETYGIRTEIGFIQNESSLQAFKAEITHFAECIFRNEGLLPVLDTSDEPTLSIAR